MGVGQPHPNAGVGWCIPPPGRSQLQFGMDETNHPWVPCSCHRVQHHVHHVHIQHAAPCSVVQHHHVQHFLFPCPAVPCPVVTGHSAAGVAHRGAMAGRRIVHHGQHGHESHRSTGLPSVKRRQDGVLVIVGGKRGLISILLPAGNFISTTSSSDRSGLVRRGIRGGGSCAVPGF